MKWKLIKLFLNIVLLGFMIPIHATLLPNFLTFTSLKMHDSPFALIIICGIWSSMLFYSYRFMNTVPEAIEESAFMDGCGVFRLLFQIIFNTQAGNYDSNNYVFISIWNELSWLPLSSQVIHTERSRSLSIILLAVHINCQHSCSYDLKCSADAYCICHS